MKDEITKSFIEKSDGVATEVYKDVLQPSLQPLGEILSFLPRTVRLLLKSWEKWLINGEESMKLVSKSIEEKMKDVPKDKIVEPEAYVAIPAIQQLCYCQDNSELRRCYANLLSSSMNSDTKRCVHPSFVDILKQINPDEAKFLHSIKNGAPFPLIDVRLVSPTGSFWTVVSNYTAQAFDKLEHNDEISSIIDNLSRLGLICISADHLSADNRYDETIQQCLSAHIIPEKKSDNWMRMIIKKLFSLSDFGKSFVKVVIE